MTAPAALEVEAHSDRAALTPAVLAGLLLSTALVPLGSTMVAVALADIGRDLGAHPAALTQWLVNSYLVVGIVLQSPAGKLGDLWGPRRVLMLGQLTFAAGAALGFVGGSLAALVLARVLMAGGGALLVPASMALLRNSTTPERRARVFGAFGASMSLSAAVGPLVGGALVQSFGWRSIFLANLPILLLAAPLVRGVAEDHRVRSTRVRFDWLGAVLLGTGLTIAVAGSKTGGASAITLLGLGAAVLVAFVWWELQAPDPVVDPALYRHRSFSAGGSIIALHNLVMYALLFQLPLWFASVMGAGSAETGRVLLAMMLSMVVCSPLGGRLSERLGARAVAVLGSGAALSGLLLLVRLGEQATPSGFIPGLVLVGAGLGLAAAPSQASAVSAITREQSGMAAGALSTMRYLGGVVGVGILGFMLSDLPLAGGGGAIEANHRVVWLFCGAMTAAAVAALFLPGLAPRPRPPEGPG